MKLPVSEFQAVACASGDKASTASPCCKRSASRRAFLAALSGGIAAAVMMADRPVMAGPFETSAFAKLIPSDKKLNPHWVASVYSRGKPTVYSKARGELQFIGMPVGGFVAAQSIWGATASFDFGTSSIKIRAASNHAKSGGAASATRKRSSWRMAPTTFNRRDRNHPLSTVLYCE